MAARKKGANKSLINVACSNASKWIMYIDKTLPMPDNYHIGNPCVNGHSHRGKTVRDKHHNCIVCVYRAARKRKIASYGFPEIGKMQYDQKLRDREEEKMLKEIDSYDFDD